jgi:hypothetical protein
MPDYSQGKIYKIECNETKLIYIGSTCEPTLSRRLSKHVHDYKSWKAGKKNYISSFQIFEHHNYDIELLESYPCNSKDELHAREKYYIKNIACVNMLIPMRTNKEYREDNKERIKIYEQSEARKLQRKKYYESDEVKQHRKEYAQSEERKQRNKELYQEHRKHKIAEYYKLNIDKIKEHQKQKFSCACGGKYNNAGKSKHFQSIMHTEYMKTNHQFGRQV